MHSSCSSPKSTSINLIDNVLHFIDKYSNCLMNWGSILNRRHICKFISLKKITKTTINICQGCGYYGNGTIDESNNLFYCSGCWNGFNDDLYLSTQSANLATESALHHFDITVPKEILKCNKKLDTSQCSHPSHLNEDMMQYMQSIIVNEYELIIWHWLRLFNLSNVESTLIHWIAHFILHNYDSNILYFRLFNNLLLQTFSNKNEVQLMQLNQSLFYQTFSHYLSSNNIDKIDHEINIIRQISITTVHDGIQATLDIFPNGYYIYSDGPEFRIRSIDICGCKKQSQHCGIWSWTPDDHLKISLHGYGYTYRDAGYRDIDEVDVYDDCHMKNNIQLFKINPAQFLLHGTDALDTHCIRGDLDNIAIYYV